MSFNSEAYVLARVLEKRKVLAMAGVLCGDLHGFSEALFKSCGCVRVDVAWMGSAPLKARVAKTKVSLK